MKPAHGSYECMLLPNVRKLFLPDPGYIIFDADLKGADAQIVAWDSGDEPLKALFRADQNLHVENARLIFHDNTITKTDPRYALAKRGVHATNYGCKARTLAANLGITVAEAEEFQRVWFHAHPGIAEWHRRVARDIHGSHAVKNAFGYRRYYFDRTDNILPEALAWIPQSTVAITINHALEQMVEAIPEVEPLLQVHDSLVAQVPKELYWETDFVARLTNALTVTVPYPDPLVIPVKLKFSELSWGDCA